MLTLGLGVGMTTAVASLTDAMLFRPQPGVADPDRLIAVYSDTPSTPQVEFLGVSHSEFLDLRAGQDLVDLGAFGRRPFILAHSDATSAEVVGDYVSGTYFPVLGAVPAAGRLLSPDDDRPGTPSVVVISHRIWQEWFDGSAAIVGDSIDLNDEPATIIGVAPAGFRGTLLDWYGESSLDVFVPMAAMERHPALGPRNVLTDRRLNILNVVGRLRPEVTMEAARAGLKTEARRWTLAYPEADERELLIRTAGQSRFWPGRYENNARLLTLLNASAALLLVVTAFNLTSLWMTRALARRREMAVRLALGAGRARLGGQVLLDALLVALAAAVVGVAAAAALLRGLAAYPSVFEVPLDLSLSLDRRMLAVSVVLSVVAAMGVGLVPALTTSRRSLVSALQDGGPSVGGGRSIRARQLLITAQVATSVVVLVTAALLVRSLGNLSQVDTGYDPEGLWVASVDARRVTLPFQAIEELGLPLRVGLLDHLEQLPDVEVVGIARESPLSLFRGRSAVVPVGSDTEPIDATWREIGPRFFEALRLPILGGRDFTRRPDAADEVVINHALAERLWPDDDPVGRLVTIQIEGEPLRVVGVVANAAHRDLRQPNEPFIYLPLFRRPISHPTMLVIRTRDSAPGFAERLRQGVDAYSGRIVVTDVRPLQIDVRDHLSRERLAATVAMLLGAMVVVLVIVGISGLFAVIVQQRAREFGIRMALGADGRRVRRYVLGDVLRLTAVGVVVGVAGWFAIHTVVESEIYGVASNDPLTVVLVSGGVLLLALGAATAPAGRAARTEPAEVLRSE